LRLFMLAFLILSPIPIIIHLLAWSLKVLHPPDIPPQFSAPACPPVFAFLGYLWAYFCIYFYSISSVYLSTWSVSLNRENLATFLGAISCQLAGEWMKFHLLWEPDLLKAYKYLYIPSNTSPM
jgi:hypothetical protein